jgi:two-component system, OmpR family, sensor histidine kinase KdpD
MYDSSETTPDRIYSRIARRGKHKVFIGMAPGVGKTYKMLEEGYQLKQDGTDVVIGVLETHGRKETAAKAEGLEVVPRQQITQETLALTEMDTEAIVDRAPQLVLVDELAHTNIPGSLREKRYQDVEILLKAGIDVYSTVNIQHLESLNDLVARLTGIVVRERIPDRILDDADEVVVVDVTPATLEERLRDGKIYAPAKIEQSLQNFFQRRNLVALRELALREVADYIEADNVRQAVCSVHERVLVCLSTEPNSMQLLRRGARAADALNARLFAIFVNHPDRFLSKSEALYIETCERLCKEFGGEFLRVNGIDTPKTIAEVAKANKITQIVMGKSPKPRWRLNFQRSFIDRVLDLLDQVDIHIISHEQNNK